MKHRPLSLSRVGGVTLMVSLMAACAQAPGLPTSAGAPADVTWLNSPNDAGEAASGKVLVKFKDGIAVRSIMGTRMIQSIEGLNGAGVYSVPDGSNVRDTLRKLRQDPKVAYAEPDFIYRAYDLAPRSEATVNDPMFSQLWGIQKIQAPAAWDTTMGDPGITVAVVDTGVDYNHEDLKGQIIKGHNFVSDTEDPMDDQGHGSHVAGTIAAIADNNVGVAGIAPHTKVLAIKVLGSDGSGDTASIAQGIIKASDMGARVINLSLGGPQESSTLKDAIDHATAKGTLCVVAAGNDGNSTVNYPAGYPNSLSVGATDQSDKRTSFSQYGSTLDIAAPGLDILSSTERSYKKHSGTSMAAPHVTGVAALLLAKNPGLTVQQLRDALTSTGDATTGFTGHALPRLNAAKAVAAVTGGAAPTPAPTNGGGSDSQAPTVPSGLKALAASGTTVQLDWNASSDDTGVAGYRVYRGGTLVGTSTSTSYRDSGLQAGTSYAYTVAAYDAAGNVSAQSAPANVTTPTSDADLTLSGVALKNVNRTSATVGWTTSMPTDSRLDYVIAAQYQSGYWQAVHSSTMVTDHSLTMTGLAPGGTYYLKVTSVDAAGHRKTAGLYGFHTPQ